MLWIYLLYFGYVSLCRSNNIINYWVYQCKVNIYFFIFSTFVHSFNNSACALTNFIYHTTNGEDKKDLPKWIGVENVVRTVKNLSQPLNVVDKEYVKAFGANSAYSGFGTKMKTYKTNFESNNIYNDGVVTKDGKNVYPLHLQGFKNSDSEDYIAINTEYETYIKGGYDVSNDLQPVAAEIKDGKTEIIRELDTYQTQFLDLETSVSSTGEQLVDNIMKIRDKAFDLFLLAFKILYGIFVAFSAGLMTLLTLYALIKCFIFKLPVHILWNVVMIVTILTLIIGSLMGILGFIFGTVSPVLTELLSPDYLNDPNSFFGATGNAAQYINTCLNGDGDLAKDLNVSNSVAAPLSQFNELAKTINVYIKQLANTSIVYQKIEDKLKNYYDKLETVTDSTDGNNQVSVVINEINSKTDNSVCGKTDYYTVNQCKDGYSEETTFTSSGKNCYKIQNLSSGFTPDYSSCSNDNEKIKAQIKYLIDIAESVRKTKTKVGTLKTECNDIYTDLNTMFTSIGKMTDSIATVLNDNLSPDSKLFDMFNCNFLATDLITFVDQFNNHFAKSCRDIGISCLVGCFLSYIGVYILLRAMYHYSPDAKKRAVKEKEKSYDKKDTERIDTEIIKIKGKS